MQLAASLALALLTAPPQGGGGGSSPLQFLIPLFIIFMIFFLLVMRPQKRREQERQSLLAALKKGDTVFTNAGVIGKVKALDEREVTIEIDKRGASMRVLRQTIGGRYDRDAEAEPKLDAAAAPAVPVVAEAAKA